MNSRLITLFLAVSCPLKHVVFAVTWEKARNTSLITSGQHDMSRSAPNRIGWKTHTVEDQPKFPKKNLSAPMNHFHQRKEIKRVFAANNWMAGLPAATPFGRMHLPGSHDTLTAYPVTDSNGGNKYAACEFQKISELLSRTGVRVLDLRLYLHDKNFLGCHGKHKSYNIEFYDALVEVITFITTNPSEFVMLMIKNDRTPKKDILTDPFWGDFVGEFNKIWNTNEVVRNTFFKPADLPSDPEKHSGWLGIQKLSTLRGKFMLVSSDKIFPDSYKGTILYKDYLYPVWEKSYDVITSIKKARVKQYWTDYHKYNIRGYVPLGLGLNLNALALFPEKKKGGLPRCLQPMAPPECKNNFQFAAEMNTWYSNYIDTEFPTFGDTTARGIVMMDFPSESRDLVNKIIRLNM